jgi:hypothetical protein
MGLLAIGIAAAAGCGAAEGGDAVRELRLPPEGESAVRKAAAAWEDAAVPASAQAAPTIERPVTEQPAEQPEERPERLSTEVKSQAPPSEERATGKRPAEERATPPEAAPRLPEDKAVVRFDARVPDGQGGEQPMRVQPIEGQFRLDPETERALRERKEPQRSLFETALEAEAAEEEVRIRLVLTNVSGEALPVHHSSGQRYDVWVVDENGEEVYRWSADKSFTAASINFVLQPDEQLVFDERWDLRDHEGRPVPAGRYTIAGAVLLRPDAGSVDPAELAAQADVVIGP